MSYISYYNRKVSQPPTRQSSRKGTGRRTIGQRANHTIHLETEEVTKKNTWAHWHIKKLFYLDQLLWVTEMPNPNPLEQCYETVREHLYDDPQLNENQFLKKSKKIKNFKDHFLLYLINLNNLWHQLPPLSQSHLPSP